MCKCLYCYRPLSVGESHFHPTCAKAFFGTKSTPTIDYTLHELDELALKVIKEQTTLTGVQPKLSLHLTEHRDERSRLTIVGLWGGYICKPQTAQYPQLPEVEDLTMHLAEVAHIAVVPHTLMPMADGSLCYLTRRIDRTSMGEKIPMEDMCQLTERQTEHKYRSSYERIAKAIAHYSAMPRLDVVNYFEVLLFSWLTGNNDMHLKNFSLYAPDGSYRLAPAYDLINASIVNPTDSEELALTLNGRKRRINSDDFRTAAKGMGIGDVVVTRLMHKYQKLFPEFEAVIHRSFLTEELKSAYIELLHNRLERI